MRKKLLYLSQLYPYPPDGGGKIKTLNTIKTLAKEYEIKAVFISEEQPTKKDLWQLERLGIKVKIFYSDRILASVKDDLLHLFWNFVRGIPHYVFQYTHSPAFPYIHNVITTFRPDIIHVDHLNIAQYLPKEKKQIWILEHHNVETYLYWTRFLHSQKLTRKLYLLIEMILTYIFERKTLRLFDHVFSISKVEEERTRKIFNVRNISTQPMIYPVVKLNRKESNKPYILFVGNLGWPPNEDTVEWFLKDIWPLIIRQISHAEFHVVGKRQPMYEKNWPTYPNVFLHGYQKSLKQFLEKAHVFVLPFRMGGGLRLKSLTAFSAGMPVASTPLGIEGLQVKHTKECFIAKDKTTFSNYVVKLLGSQNLRGKMSTHAVMYIQRYHGENLNKKFLLQYDAIVKRFL